MFGIGLTAQTTNDDSAPMKLSCEDWMPLRYLQVRGGLQWSECWDLNDLGSFGEGRGATKTRIVSAFGPILIKFQDMST